MRKACRAARSGAPEGVLDTYRLLRVIEAVGVLVPSNALTASEQTGLEAWFGAYADWMQTAPTGKAERAAKNNHGLWYDYQLATFAPVRAPAELGPRGARQRGSQPHRPRDRARWQDAPRSCLAPRRCTYSYFALEPLIGMAELGPCVGVDLWGYRGPQGQGIRAALAYLGQFVGNEAAFPYKDLKPEDATREALPLYDLAAAAYGDAGFAAKAEMIAGPVADGSKPSDDRAL